MHLKNNLVFLYKLVCEMKVNITRFIKYTIIVSFINRITQ